MRALVQRVRGISSIEYQVPDSGEKHLGSFEGPGLVVLCGWQKTDLASAPNDVDYKKLSEKEEWIRSHVMGLRIFPDKEQRMNLNLVDYLAQEEREGQGGILWVPQFTLAGELSSGFRPSFINLWSLKLLVSVLKLLCRL